MHTTNYTDTFITISPDSRAERGIAPPASIEKPTVASRTWSMIHDHPYKYTSDDVIFTVYADRKGIPAQERATARAQFFARGQVCLRASDLGKRYGWGIHADSEGRVALHGVETAAYQAFANGAARTGHGDAVVVKAAMRSGRG